MYGAMAGCARTVGVLLSHGASLYARMGHPAYGVRGCPPAHSSVLVFSVLGFNVDCVKELLKSYVSASKVAMEGRGACRCSAVHRVRRC